MKVLFWLTRVITFKYFSYRKRIDITIDEHLLKQFKEYCRQAGLNMSRVIEKYIKQELIQKI